MNGAANQANAAQVRTVAFIGLGNMGAPMASRLLRAGYDLRLYDVRRDVLRQFTNVHGGRACTSLADAVQDAQVAIAMLPVDDAVRTVMLGKSGLVSLLPRGGIAVDMGTSSPSSTRQIAAAFSHNDRAFVDAPVMGGVPFARDGTLDIMAGGNADAVERCLPLFDAMGRKTYRCGASGTGHALKAIANFANAATLVTFLEAMTIGRKSGLETGLMVEALTAMCTGRQHPLEKKIVAQVLTRRYHTGMALGLLAKDMAIAARLGEDIGARHTIASQVRDLWMEAVQRYGFDRDQTVIADLWEDDSDVRL